MGKNKRKYPDQSEEDKIKSKLAKLQTKVKKPPSPVVLEIREKTAAVVKNRKHANNILEIISYLELETPGTTAAAALEGLKRIFSVAIEKHELQKGGGDNADAEQKYRVWMSERFNEVIKKTSVMIHHSKASVSSLALSTLMSFISCLWSADDKKNISGWGGQEKEILNNIVLSCISNKHQSRSVIARYQEHLLYVDVKFYFLKQLSKIVGVAVKNEKVNAVFTENVLRFLEVISMDCVEEKQENSLKSFLCNNLQTGESSFKLGRDEMKNYFSSCWLQILKCRINLDQFKRVLLILDDKVLPYMSKPLLMTDFLMTSYNVGGSISLLALSGVFTLISKYNLEYPEFYTKLYKLFTPELLHVKYKARFFHLANIFLSSSHLPGN